MSPRSLLRLYPRAWRERYGDEFLDACGDRPLTFQQGIDIVCGAVDARFAPQSHLVASTSPDTHGVKMSAYLKVLCSRPAPRMTIMDGVKGAIAIIVSSVALVGLSRIAHRAGWHDGGRVISDLATPISTLVMSHVMFMRGQSTMAKTVITGGALTILILGGIISVIH